MQFLLALLLMAVSYAAHCVAETAAELRAAGDTALAANDLKTALGHYTKLIEVEPTKAMNFYKRAGILLRQRQYAKVLPDLNSALSLDPKFVEGYLHRAKVYGLRGDCEQAKGDYETVLKLKPGNAQATKQIPEMNECTRVVAIAVDMAKRGDCHSANHYADLGLKIASESPKLIVVKAQCALNAKDYHAAIAETRKVLSADASNLDALAIRGAAYYGLGENDAAISHFREGLRLDPEHKLMKTTYKKLRALQKAMASGDAAMESGAFDEAAESFEDALRVDPDHHLHQLSLYVKLCRAYVKAKKPEPCANACARALQYDSNNFDAYLLRGECHLVGEKPQDALNDFQKAHQLNQGSQAAQEGMHRAQVEVKKASRKDYYKILGVAKNASAKQIKKAFRKLALELHPDKQQHADDAARKAAEVKFREFTEAYEVLGNAENKQKYDNGEDININEQNMNQHFQHFHFPQGFGFPGGGGGGGQQFHFRFN